MRQPRNEPWVIAEQDDGSYDVWHGRRQVTTGLQALTTANTIVGQHRRVNERVWVAATDGYRTEITKKFRDPEPPKKPASAPVAHSSRPLRNRYLARYGRRS